MSEQHRALGPWSQIAGFLRAEKRDVRGGAYRGRLTLPGVQWTGVGADAFVTFTLTADQLRDAAESRLLWTDQGVQRGVNPAAPGSVPRELAVADGYPDKRYYIFEATNADDMAEKLLRGDRLFLSPLVWNLRPGMFEAFWSEEEQAIFLYQGKVFLPDSHHRHQAIVKAVREKHDHPRSFPKFTTDRQFKIELYFLDREGEGNYFFDKNQLPKRTAMSKAYDLTTQDDLSVLAKRVLDKAPWLDAGVNRVTDRLSRKAPYFMTLSTLREAMKTFASSKEIDDTEMEGLAIIAAEFLGIIGEVRPELRVETAHAVREKTLASSAVMIHAYAALMSDYNADIAQWGRSEARSRWAAKLGRLSPANAFTDGKWTGDILAKDNPLWAHAGIIKRDPGGTTTVLNTGGTRAQAGRILRKYVGGSRRRQPLNLLDR